MKAIQKNFWILSLVIFTILSSCSKNEIPLPDPSLEKLFGQWQWVYTDCGWTGTTYASYDLIVVFKKDGIYEEYKNGRFIKKTEFTLTKVKSIYDTSYSYYINFKDIGPIKNNNDTYSLIIQFTGQDTLWLGDGACDGCTSMYVRKK